MFSERLIEPDLVRINRSFGGHSAVRRTLAGVADKNEQFTLLDVGAASGDTARLLRPLYPHARVTSLDYNLVNLEQAPQPKVIADAFTLPLKAASFDYVFCSSFLHHFRDEQVTELLRSFYAVARKALVVIDLERHILPFWFLRASQPFYGWGRITVHDGQISVRASFQKQELLRLAREAGIREAVVKRYRPAFRLALIGRK